MMADDTTSLLNKNPSSTSSSISSRFRNGFYENSTLNKPRLVQLIFVGSIILMVFITISLSIYRGVKLGQNGFLYFMLGVSLIGFVVIEMFMVNFIRKGELAQEKSWFLYFVGGCVFLESLFTDILLMR